ncbi:MAG: SUMF1/EgtB/PvdO family nonheme iron enzyme [Williamsia sp.]|nr:SUMF1/EgtB/PvdO family nonheme iron enzyme [Williamsia sp.]
MRKLFACAAITVLSLCSSLSIQANNIQISNVQLLPGTSSSGYATIQFNISWENSWYLTSAPSNYDAAWVFVKWRKNGSSFPWKHVYLRDEASYHTITNSGVAWGAMELGKLNPGSAGFNGTSNTSNPVVGVFIKRSSAEAGSGNTPLLTVKLRWYYQYDDFNGTGVVSSGLGTQDAVDIKVDGIEMVNVPSGPYYLGSGGSENNAFHTPASASTPYLVSSEGAISLTGSNVDMTFTGSGSGMAGDPNNIPAPFPKGYNSFYCMKYEMSLQQYVDFLNTIPAANAGNYASINSSTHYNLSVSGGVYSTTLPFKAAAYVTAEALLAFLDWAALRPMTELEYEKACRGSASSSTPNAPAANEFAWGTNGSAVALTAVSNLGTTNEVASTPSNANVVATESGNSLEGTARGGIFATANSNRVSSGASFYGIMEMSGNVWERAVSVGTSGSLSFTGAHGDGDISTSPSNWPAGPPSYDGFGFRGGSFLYNGSILAISDRLVASFKQSSNNEAHDNWGGRGVRTQ